jgi:hypothetical protein
MRVAAAARASAGQREATSVRQGPQRRRPGDQPDDERDQQHLREQ